MFPHLSLLLVNSLLMDLSWVLLFGSQLVLFSGHLVLIPLLSLFPVQLIIVVISVQALVLLFWIRFRIRGWLSGCVVVLVLGCCSVEIFSLSILGKSGILSGRFIFWCILVGVTFPRGVEGLLLAICVYWLILSRSTCTSISPNRSHLSFFCWWTYHKRIWWI